MVKIPNGYIYIYIYIFVYCIYEMMTRSQYFPTCCSHFVCWNSLASPLASKTLNFQVCSIWNSWNADNPSAPPNEVEQFLPDCYIFWIMFVFLMTNRQRYGVYMYIYIYNYSFALLIHDISICRSWRSITSLKILMTISDNYMWYIYIYCFKMISQFITS